MAAQASEQYYSADGHLAVAANPAIKVAWETAAQAGPAGPHGAARPGYRGLGPRGGPFLVRHHGLPGLDAAGDQPPGRAARVRAMECDTAAVGKIFGQTADRTPAAPLGPASAAIT